MSGSGLPLDDGYAERVYAGVLGKLIGVYLGRPIEGWEYERIQAEFGQINYYVHEALNVPLIVTDDDITGTFTFVRALADHRSGLAISAERIGQSWMNYLIENRTILWWGGLGNSTEHTAFLRLKAGIPAPASGSMHLNSQLVAEQIGAQIFIDSWAMVVPGQPTLAAQLARTAGSVSHDGEALNAAAVWAAMESEAFVNQDTNHLIETALSLTPPDSVISQVIRDVRAWHAEDEDWRETRQRIEDQYGYKRYGGNVHVVPNHALMHLGLLYGEGDFSRSMMVVNSSGWDTDCNSGNLGALLGLQLGLAGIDSGRDWRGPISDKLYLPSADGTRAISDAVREAYEIVNIARSLEDEVPLSPKGGARFHFSMPGSVQGFTADGEGALAHADGSLKVVAIGGQVSATTPTFIPPDFRPIGYELIASPTLYPGQRVIAHLSRCDGAQTALAVSVVVNYYGLDDEIETYCSPALSLHGGEPVSLATVVPDTGGQPVASVGIRLEGEGAVNLDSLDWRGTPEMTWRRPARGRMWASSWVDAADHFQTRWAEDAFRAIQDSGTGIVSSGGPWRDLRTSADLTPHFAAEVGLAARVVGRHRYVAVSLTQDGLARLHVRDHDSLRLVASLRIEWELGRAYSLQLETDGNEARAWVDGQLVGEGHIADAPDEGAIGLLVTEGRVGTNKVTVSPLDTQVAGFSDAASRGMR